MTQTAPPVERMRPAEAGSAEHPVWAAVYDAFSLPFELPSNSSSLNGSDSAMATCSSLSMSVQSPRLRRIQDLLTPATRRLTGGCHLNRPSVQTIERHFEIQSQWQKGILVQGMARPDGRPSPPTN